MSRLGLSLVAVVAVGCGVCTLAGFVGQLWWLFDLCAHFRVQYALGLLLCTTILVAARRDVVAAACGLGVVVNVAVIAPLHFGGDDVVANAPAIHVVTFNINDANTRYDEVIAYLRSADADIIAVLEVDDEWDQRLRVEFADYEATGEWRIDSFGILVLSRLPASNAGLVRLGGEDIGAVEMDIEAGATQFSLLAVHTLPPIRGSWSRRRDSMIEAIAAWARLRSHPAIIIGDLNATPWSAPFRNLLSATGLKNSQRGFGVEPTWPRSLPILGVPIDHALVPDSLLVADRWRGPHLGSDHRPLHLVLALPL